MKKYLIGLLKYSALVGFGVGLSLGMLELGIRLVGIRPATYLRQFSEFHAMLGWIKTPFAEGYFQRGDVRIHEKLNSRGLRNPEYDYRMASGTVRILFLGDSFTEGYDVDVEDLFTTILEQELNRRNDGTKYEVINAGTGGYSTDQEYLFYETEGYKYSPDVVVLMFYAINDVYYALLDKYGNYPKPRFALTDSGLALVNMPLKEPPQTEGLKNILRNLALYQVVLNRVLPQFPGMTRWLASMGLLSSETAELATRTQETPAWFRVFERNPPKEIEMAWIITDSLIAAIHERVKSQGARFIVFAIPDRFQIYEDSWQQTQKEYAVDDSLWDRRLPEKRLKDLCNTRGITFIDFADSLKQRGLSERLYDGVHWNERGNVESANVLLHTITGELKQISKSR